MHSLLEIISKKIENERYEKFRWEPPELVNYYIQERLEKIADFLISKTEDNHNE
jgi:hypothetical protein